MVFVPMPRLLTVLTAAAFGPALGFASVGLRYFLELHRDSVAAQIAAVSNLLAGALVTAMLFVQLAVAYHRDDYFAGGAADDSVRPIIRWIWDAILGLDVAFDVFVGLGTLMFGVSMLRHPRIPKLVAWAGIVVGGVVVLAMNFYTFPTPPADAGLFDPGPFVGLWYLVVVIVVLRALGWVDERLAASSDGAGGQLTAPPR